MVPCAGAAATPACARVLQHIAANSTPIPMVPEPSAAPNSGGAGSQRQKKQKTPASSLQWCETRSATLPAAATELTGLNSQRKQPGREGLTVEGGTSRACVADAGPVASSLNVHDKRGTGGAQTRSDGERLDALPARYSRKTETFGSGAHARTSLTLCDMHVQTTVSGTVKPKGRSEKIEIRLIPSRLQASTDYAIKNGYFRAPAPPSNPSRPRFRLYIILHSYTY